MPTSLLDLPDELLEIICNLFALSWDESLGMLVHGLTHLENSEAEDRRALLSLCLTSKRIRAAARQALHLIVQPTDPFRAYSSTKYRHSLLAAKLRGCQSLVLVVGTGNEFHLLRGLFTLKRLYLLFDKHLSITSASQISLELSTRPSIKILSLHLEACWHRQTYVYSRLRMVTNLHHLRDLYIGGLLPSLAGDLVHHAVSPFPLQLDRLRISIYMYLSEAEAEAQGYFEQENENEDAQEDEVEVHEAEAVIETEVGALLLSEGGVKHMDFVQIEGTMIWTRKL